jgi:hypothetical protein
MSFVINSNSPLNFDSQWTIVSINFRAEKMACNSLSPRVACVGFLGIWAAAFQARARRNAAREVLRAEDSLVTKVIRTKQLIIAEQ